MVRYYKATNRTINASMMRWYPTGTIFHAQWIALQHLKEDDDPDVPKISKSLPIEKWRDAFVAMLRQCIGIRDISLMYLIRSDVAVPAPPPALRAHPAVMGAIDCVYPHSEDAGSIGAELILRASHDHVLYKDDNKKLFHLLSEATMSTQYASILKPKLTSMTDLCQSILLPLLRKKC